MIIEYDTTKGEPPHGSILMAESVTGTAYQRFFSDGLYHGTNGKVLTFDELRTNERAGGRRPLFLVHDTTPYTREPDDFEDGQPPEPIYVDGAVLESERGLR